MKLLSKISFVLLALFILSCKNNQEPEVKTVDSVIEETAAVMDPDANYARAEFTIDGMTCAVGCAKTIEKKLAGMEGVQTASVDFDKKLAMVVYNEAMVNPESLTETVTKAGEAYKVSDMKTEGYTAETATKKECKPDCKKACCNKEAKAETSTSEEKPMGCKKDCKMPCCAGKA